MLLNNNKHFHLGVFVHAWIVANFLTPNCIRGFRTWREKKNQTLKFQNENATNNLT